MIVYHGSSVLFDNFDLERHVLEGDGKVKFGYGVYVTSSYKSAAHYAFNKRRPENGDYYVYTLDIPDRTDANCLSLLKGVRVNDAILDRCQKKLSEYFPYEATVEGTPFRKYLANRLLGLHDTPKKMISKTTVEGEKLASQFLLSIGVELIEWPFTWTKPEGDKNYAVLDDQKVKVVCIDKVELDDKKQFIPGSEQRIKTF